MRVVCLDVIPGKKGDSANLGKKLGSTEDLKRNRDIIDKAAKQGFHNMMQMKAEKNTKCNSR